MFLKLILLSALVSFKFEHHDNRYGRALLSGNYIYNLSDSVHDATFDV